MRQALALLYLAAVPTLAAAAVYVWRLRCEGFGCMGIGVAWIAWALVYVAALILGAVLASAPIAQGRLQAITRGALALQLGLGVVALALWVGKRWLSL
jgi:hypothetical protein